MNKLHYLLFALLITGLSVSGQTVKNNQTTDKFIRVGDTTINLNDVDLEKGLVVKRLQYVRNCGEERVKQNYFVQIKLFTSPNRDNYALVLDTVSWLGESWNRDIETDFQYYNEHGKLLFEKKFIGFSLYLCYISANNKVVAFSRTNEDYEGYDFYKSDGTLIKEYSTSEKLYVGPLHRNFFICNVMYDCNGANTFDHIDESGNIEEVVFPKGFFRGIKFSPQENYYIVSLDNQQLFYDINNVFIWKQPKDKGFIYFLKDEKSYLLSEPSTNYIKIKDLFTHQLKYKVDSVIYNGNKIPIYRSFLLNGDFYVIGKKDSIYIYNFYNERGELLQTETVPVLRKVKPYKVLKKDGKFIIKPRINDL